MDPHYEGVIFQTHVRELARRATIAFPGVTIVDVRPAGEFANGHIAGAISASAAGDDLASHLEGASDVVIVGGPPEDPEVRRSHARAARGRIRPTDRARRWHALLERGGSAGRDRRRMMTPLLFWDVDTQVDFLSPDGKLYVQNAERRLPNLERLTAAAQRHDVPVLASADDHEPGDAEISDDPDWENTFPPHCMRGTPGADRVAETAMPDAAHVGHDALGEAELAQALAPRPARLLVHKKRFDVFSNPNADRLLEALDPQRIVVYGVALDVCNRYAVEGLLARNRTGIEVVVDATEAIQPERGEGLLEEWRQRGVALVTTDEVLASLEES